MRAVLALDRGASAVARVVSTARDELLLAWISPERRARINDAIYAAQRSYAPGGRTFQQGLFDWEQSAIAHDAFPRHGRVLVGGAGGGREIAALRALGYDVTGFDPCEPLVASGRELLGANDATSLLTASYADVVRAARGEPTPLAPLFSRGRYDAVVLGWGSFSYLASDEEAIELLRAIRRLAPAAPVLLSFLRPTGGADAAAGRLRSMLRRAFARLGAPGRVGARDSFAPWSGFYRAVAMDDVGTMAERAGYEVAILRADWYAHALLVPAGGEQALAPA